MTENQIHSKINKLKNLRYPVIDKILASAQRPWLSLSTEPGRPDCEGMKSR